MQGIFINYRRVDTSAFSRLLYDRLSDEFGEDLVFMDVETIREPGTDFVETINNGIDKCVVLLALIGRDWLIADSDGKRRLDNPDDFVRLEIAAALKRNVRVIPVIVEDAEKPAADDLPDEIKMLARRQALTLDHEDWEYHIGKLVDALARIPGLNPIRPNPPPPHPDPVRKGWSTGALAFTAFAAVVVVLVVLMSLGSQEPQPLPDPDPPIPQPLTDEIRVVQQRLAALDYNPGVIDGVMGGATVSAIREFQDDEGHPLTGRVDAGLLVQLQSALNARESQPVPQPIINMSGTWYDDIGTAFVLKHDGNLVRIGVKNSLNQLNEIGNGRIDGRVLTIRYSYLGDTGRFIATLAQDNRHLNGTDMADDGSSELMNLHYEHLRGQ